MTKGQLISKIDQILEGYQFQKIGSVWNRHYPEFIDVMDLQISKSKETFTMNAGVADKFVLRTCWGIDGSDIVQEPSCTIRARLGELLHGRDVWWELSDDVGIEEALNCIQEAAIPFLELNHNVDRMIETLESDPASRRYPPEIIYLALLRHRKGESDRCEQMLKSMKLTGAWGQKTADILSRMN